MSRLCEKRLETDDYQVNLNQSNNELCTNVNKKKQVKIQTKKTNTLSDKEIYHSRSIISIKMLVHIEALGILAEKPSVDYMQQ